MKPPFEQEHATLIARLAEARPAGPGAAFSRNIAGRIGSGESRNNAELRGILRTARPAMPVGESFAQDVLARVRATQASRHGDATLHADSDAVRAPRWARWVSYAGTAVAAGLAVAFMYAPVEQALRGSHAAPPAGHMAPAAPPESIVPPENTPPLYSPISGQVRYSRSYEGRERWIVDIGLIEGARTGDLLDWYSAGKRAGSFRIRGISDYYALCEIEGIQKTPPRTYDRVYAASVTQPMKRAAAALKQGHLAAGSFFGLGIVVEETPDGLVVHEVIAEMWRPEWPHPRPSRAAALGLRPNDRILSVQGREIATESEFEVVLTALPLDTKLAMTIDRGGQALRVNER